jgi:phage terminase small subunit
MASSHKPAAKKPRKPGTGIRKAAQLAKLAGADATTEDMRLRAKREKARTAERAKAAAAVKADPTVTKAGRDEELAKIYAEEYVTHFNKGAAYLAIRPDVKNPKDCANDYMRRPVVQAAVRKAREEKEARRAAEGGLTRDKVLSLLERMLLHDPREMYNDDGTLKAPTEMSDDSALVLNGFEAATKRDDRSGKFVSTATNKVKTVPREALLQLAMRHHGLLNDKLDLSVSGRLEVWDAAAMACLTADELEQLDRITAKMDAAREAAKKAKEAGRA